jgi:type IV secretion system protein VirD4
MIGSCIMRIYMNPSSHGGTAKRLSEELGFTESIIDGSRQPMMEASAMTGPKFANYQLAFARNTKPTRLEKGFDFNEPVIAERLGKPIL